MPSLRRVLNWSVASKYRVDTELSEELAYGWAHLKVNAVHDIRPDKTWPSWTHTGASYAALVVRPEFDAFVRRDRLPQVGGYVLARTIVEGARK